MTVRDLSESRVTACWRCVLVAGARSPGATNTLEIDNNIYFGGYKGQHTYPYVLPIYDVI